MNKIMLSVAAAFLICGSGFSSLALAQQPPRKDEMQPHLTAVDRAAFAKARIAAVHVGLALSAEQEKLWPPIEVVLEDMAKKRADRFEAMRAEREKSDGKPDVMAHLRRQADFMTQRAADLKRLADAAQPLYDKLDDAQKRRLQILLHQGMRERTHGMHMRG